MAQVLRRLAPASHPDLLVGVDTLDDAGVYRLRADLALVQTVDFFPPLVDDPYVFGQIAAANALSDVYAMGGRPLTALNIVGFPDNELSTEVLGEILRGGGDKVLEAGAVIAGGHSVRDAEVKYGLAVTGLVHPDEIWTNAGARPGDALLLGKPIGSGVLTSAVKSGRLAEAELGEALRVMTMLNRAAQEAARAAGPVHACTDVTGYGLIGHANEMAAGSGVTVELWADAVPLLRHALELARAGVLTRAHKSTRAHLGAALEVHAGVEPPLAGLLLDAQTSGGLLLSVPESSVAALLRAGMAHVGRVLPRDAASVILRPHMQ